MTSNAAGAFTLRALITALYARKWITLGLFLASAVTILGAVMVWPYSYEARATLLVKLGRENVAVPGMASSSSQVLKTGLSREEINTEIEMLLSRVLAQNVVKQLGPDYLDPPGQRQPGLVGTLKWVLVRTLSAMLGAIKDVAVFLGFDREYTREERIVQNITQRLSADPVQQSHIIEVRLRWGDPEPAARVLEHIVKGYLELHSNAFSQPGQQAFFKEQAELLASRIAVQERELEALQTEHRVYIGTAQERVLQERLAQSKSALQATLAELSELRSQLQDLRRRLDSAGNARAGQQFAPDAVIGEQRRRLNDLEIERTKLQSRYLPSSEVVRNLEAEIVAQRARIREQETDLIQRQIRTLDATTGALLAKEKTQRAQIEAEQMELEGVTRHSVEIRRLQRQIQNDEESYATYRKKLEEARITDVLDHQRNVNVAVVQPVAVPERPVAPRKALVAILGLVFSLVFAIAVALALEFFGTSIRGVDDVERVLGLPYLGSVREW